MGPPGVELMGPLGVEQEEKLAGVPLLISRPF